MRYLKRFLLRHLTWLIWNMRGVNTVFGLLPVVIIFFYHYQSNLSLPLMMMMQMTSNYLKWGIAFPLHVTHKQNLQLLSGPWQTCPEYGVCLICVDSVGYVGYANIPRSWRCTEISWKSEKRQSCSWPVCWWRSLLLQPPQASQSCPH